MGVVQQDAPQAHPHASLLPLLEPSLTGSATPESQGEGEGTPGQPPAQDVQNAGQGLAGGDTGASTVGTGWGRWKTARTPFRATRTRLPFPSLSSAPSARKSASTSVQATSLRMGCSNIRPRVRR